MDKLVLLAYCTNDLTDLIREAEKRKLSWQVLTTSESLAESVSDYNPTHVVGVCCEGKIDQYIKYLDSLGISYKAIPTAGNDLCFKSNNVKRNIAIREYIEALNWLSEQ